MERTKETILYVLNALLDLLSWCVKKLIRFWLRIDRYVIKRYFNLETPLYKFWWKNHAVAMQKRLDKQHGIIKN